MARTFYQGNLAEELAQYLQGALPGEGDGTYHDAYSPACSAIESALGNAYARQWAQGTRRGKYVPPGNAPRDPIRVLWSIAERFGWKPDPGIRYFAGVGKQHSGKPRSLHRAVQGVPGNAEALIDLPVERAGAFRLVDVKEAPVWFGCEGKGNLYARRYGRLKCWKQSMTPPKGVVADVRQGKKDHQDVSKDGKPYKVDILPHMPYRDIARRIHAIRQGVKGWRARDDADFARMRPAISLAGDAGWRMPLPLAVLDVDYAPGLDADGVGLRLRNQLGRFFLAQGYAVFRSGGGNGLHVLAGVERLDGYAAISGQGKIAPGLGIEIYLPGAKRLIAFAGKSAGVGLPDGDVGVLPFGYIDGAIRKAKSRTLTARDLLD